MNQTYKLIQKLKGTKWIKSPLTGDACCQNQTATVKELNVLLKYRHIAQAETEKHQKYYRLCLESKLALCNLYNTIPTSMGSNKHVSAAMGTALETILKLPISLPQIEATLGIQKEQMQMPHTKTTGSTFSKKTGMQKGRIKISHAKTANFTYWQDGQYQLGYLSEYPAYITQDLTLKGLKEHLMDIYITVIQKTEVPTKPCLKN
jgi:hypothetical protein